MSDHHLKRLVLLRHAKSDYPMGVSDHERPLASRGNREAPAAGAWLRENDVVPNFIITSDALRTRSTCAWIISELGEKAPTPYLDPRVYGASSAKLCAIINETPETVTTLLVIGHQPVLQELAMRLASVDSDEEAVYELAMDYPTLGLTVLQTDKDWAEIDGRDMRVTNFVVPR